MAEVCKKTEVNYPVSVWQPKMSKAPFEMSRMMVEQSECSTMATNLDGINESYDNGVVKYAPRVPSETSRKTKYTHNVQPTQIYLTFWRSLLQLKNVRTHSQQSLPSICQARSVVKPTRDPDHLQNFLAYSNRRSTDLRQFKQKLGKNENVMSYLKTFKIRQKPPIISMQLKILQWKAQLKVKSEI